MFVHVSSPVPLIITWHICQTIIDCLFLVVIACVLNQSKDHWLLSDALNSAIIMSSKLKENVGIVQNLNQFMDNDFVITLEFYFILFLTLKKKFVVSLIIFFHF
jgi:hypothetical protein